MNEMTTTRQQRGTVPALMRDTFRQLLDEWMDGPLHELESTVGAWSPRTDIEKTDEGYVLHAEVPGVDADDIEITIEDNTVTVRGERRFYDERDEDGFNRIERRFGSFHRSIRLPEPINADAVEARHDNGVLTLTIPTREDAKARRIKVTPS
jgi:HSP20 family protein